MELTKEKLLFIDKIFGSQDEDNSLKEAIKKQYGVDTYTLKEIRIEIEKRGWTKEITRKYYENIEMKGQPQEQIEEIINGLYPEYTN